MEFRKVVETELCVQVDIDNISFQLQDYLEENLIYDFTDNKLEREIVDTNEILLAVADRWKHTLKKKKGGN